MVSRDGPGWSVGLAWVVSREGPGWSVGRGLGGQ